MSVHTRPVTLVILPENQKGFLEILQDIHTKAGNAALDIDGYHTFRDASYLSTAEEELDELQIMIRLLQVGLIASQYSREVPS